MCSQIAGCHISAMIGGGSFHRLRKDTHTAFEERIIDMNNQPAESIKNSELVAAMRAMVKHDSPQNRSRMAAALAEAKLLSPIQTQTVLMEKEGPSTRIRFEEIRNTEGDSYYLAFTDIDEYNKWNDDESHNQALIMRLEDFGNILIRNINDLKGFVINPYGENISISKELLLSLLKQKENKMKSRRGN